MNRSPRGLTIVSLLLDITYDVGTAYIIIIARLCIITRYLFSPKLSTLALISTQVFDIDLYYLTISLPYFLLLAYYTSARSITLVDTLAGYSGETMDQSWAYSLWHPTAGIINKWDRPSKKVRASQI